MNAIQTLLTEYLDIWTDADTEKKSGRGRSSGNADRVYGIRKLRELILELAVRGKLVPQDPNDEPASVLLKRIQAEKAKLVAEGKIKKDKPLPPITDDERPFELPNGWLWTTLTSISLVNPRNNAEDNSPASFVPMTMIGTKFNSSHDQEARLWKEIKQGFTHFAEGDIGVAKITPCFENSKACVFSGLLSGIGAGTTELHIVRPINATLAPRYVLAYLKSPQFLLVGETRMTGTAGQKRLPKEFVESNPFPLPPLQEQHRIVAKVDELMALCDQLEQQQTHSLEAHQNLVASLVGTLTRVASQQEFSAAWTRIANHFDTLFTTEASIDQLKQTLLQLAVMGKLVPQNPNDEPASVLLEKIAEEKKRMTEDGLIKKQIPLSPIEEDEKPLALPDGWECVRFGTVAVIERGGSPRPINSYLTNDPDGLNWIKIGDTDQGGKYITSTSEKIRREGLSKTRMVYPGDFLLTNSMSFGRPYITKIEGCIHDGWLRISPPNTVDKDYLYLLLSSPYIREAFKVAAAGAVVQNLNADKVRELVIPIPPINEQHRIVAKVDELMVLCNTLKARLADAQAIQLRLADAIVEQAIC